MRKQSPAQGELRSQSTVSGSMAGMRALAVALLLISFAATLSGILKLIEAQSDTALDRLSVAMIAFMVLSLTVLMWQLLKTLRDRHGVLLRIAAAVLYLPVVAWSVGFGFGFWWDHLASYQENRDSLQNELQKFTTSLARVQGSIITVNTSLEDAQKASQQQIELEATVGGTCGKESSIGQGPLFYDRSDFHSRLTSEINLLGSTLGQIESEIVATQSNIGETLESMRSVSKEERAAQYSELADQATLAAARLGASLRATLGKSERSLTALANRIGDPALRRNANRCFDAVLASQLRDTADLVHDVNPVVAAPDFVNMEGNIAVPTAFARLWKSISMPLRPNESPGIAQGGLHGVEWIALLAAVIVDLGIVLAAFAQPRRPLQEVLSLGMPSAVSEGRVREMLSGCSPDANATLLRSHFQLGNNDYLAAPTAQWRPEEPSREVAEELRSHLLQLRAMRLIRAVRVVDPRRWPWRDLVKTGNTTLLQAGWRPEVENAPILLYRIGTANMGTVSRLSRASHRSSAKRLADAAEHPGARRDNEELSDEVRGKLDELADLSKQLLAARKQMLESKPVSDDQPDQEEGDRSEEVRVLHQTIERLRLELRRHGVELVGAEGEAHDPAKHMVEGTVESVFATGKVALVSEYGFQQRVRSGRIGFGSRMVVKKRALVKLSSGTAYRATSVRPGQPHGNGANSGHDGAADQTEFPTSRDEGLTEPWQAATTQAPLGNSLTRPLVLDARAGRDRTGSNRLAQSDASLYDRLFN